MNESCGESAFAPSSFGPLEETDREELSTRVFQTYKNPVVVAEARDSHTYHEPCVKAHNCLVSSIVLIFRGGRALTLILAKARGNPETLDIYSQSLLSCIFGNIYTQNF